MSVGPITAALIASGGAVVGGAITSISGLAAEKHRTKHAREDMANARKRELRRAARVTRRELASNATLFREALEQETWKDPKEHFVQRRWEESASTLASELPDNVWDAVDDAYSLLDRMVAYEMEGHSGGLTETAQKLADEIEGAVVSLRPYSKHDGE
jgi:hypothetical protein